jgi:hypothetical protein
VSLINLIYSKHLTYPRIVSEKIRHYTNRRYYKYLPSQNTTTYTSIIRILLLSGDISTNPGPVRYPCGKCSKPVKRNQRGIYCEDCTYWYHIKCIDLPKDEYQRLSTSSESWSSIIRDLLPCIRCLGDQFALEMQGCELQLKLLLE